MIQNFLILLTPDTIWKKNKNSRRKGTLCRAELKISTLSKNQEKRLLQLDLIKPSPSHRMYPTNACLLGYSLYKCVPKKCLLDFQKIVFFVKRLEININNIAQTLFFFNLFTISKLLWGINYDFVMTILSIEELMGRCPIKLKIA